MSEIEIFLRLAFFGLAMIMFALSMMSFANTREAKIGLATAGFGLFAVEGAVLSAGVFSSTVEGWVTMSMVVAVNFLALILLYLSIIKR